MFAQRFGNPVPTAVLSAGAVLVGVLAGGCSLPAAAPADSAVQHSTPGSTTPSPLASHPRFPGQELTATLLGYDDNARMVRFQLARNVAGGPDDGHYQTDPADPGEHRLPLSGAPEIRGAASLCPTGDVTVDEHGTGTAPCTSRQLIEALHRSPVRAQLHVDGADRIDRVSELYHP